jgi:hypothetical protein
MTALQGYGGYVAVGTGPATLVNVKQWELPLAADKYDVTSINQSTPVWKQYIPGLLGADGKIDVFWDMTDTTGQVALQTAYFTAVSIAVVLNLSTSHKYSGTAYVTGIDIKVPVNGPQEASLQVTFTGSISYS